MFFVRCYRKGAAKSGTSNLDEWDSCPDLNTFHQTCEGNGEGKYVLFQRGKGIRGMKKINEYIVEQQDSESSEAASISAQKRTNNASISDLLVFAAEEFKGESTVAVKKNMSMGDFSDDELIGVLEQMSDKKVSGAEEFEAFTKDIKSLLGEVKKRGMSSDGYSEAMATKDAETPLQGKGMTFATGIIVGGLGGVAATAYHYRGKLDAMEQRFAALESSLKETENTLKKESEERGKEKRAAEAVQNFDNRLNLDASFLSNFNGNNGPQY
jgi:hypothetical protein|tara:strand:- start:3087 stop:3893 length:807 start_codon:yes stop_codon:yes gene_type:complete